MRISDWSSDVCSSDLVHRRHLRAVGTGADRKALAAAFGAELMVDVVLVELIGFELVGAALQPEPVDGDEGQRSEERRVGKECVVRVTPGGRRSNKNKKVRYIREKQGE